MNIVKNGDSIAIKSASDKLIIACTKHFGIVIDANVTTDEICQEVKKFIVDNQFKLGLTDRQMLEACAASNMNNINTYKQAIKYFDKPELEKRGVYLSVIINLFRYFNGTSNTVNHEGKSCDIVKFKLDDEIHSGKILTTIKAGEKAKTKTKNAIGTALFSSIPQNRLKIGDDVSTVDRYLVSFNRKTRLFYYAVIPVTDVISEEVK